MSDKSKSKKRPKRVSEAQKDSPTHAFESGEPREAGRMHGVSLDLPDVKTRGEMLAPESGRIEAVPPPAAT